MFTKHNIAFLYFKLILFLNDKLSTLVFKQGAGKLLLFYCSYFSFFFFVLAGNKLFKDIALGLLHAMDASQ